MVNDSSEEKRHQRKIALYVAILGTAFTVFLAIVFIDEGLVPQDYVTYIIAFWAMIWIFVILVSIVRDRGKSRENKWYVER